MILPRSCKREKENRKYYKEYEAEIGKAVIDNESGCSFLLNDIYAFNRFVEITVYIGDGKSVDYNHFNLGEQIDVGKDHSYSLICKYIKDHIHCIFAVIMK